MPAGRRTDCTRCCSDAASSLLLPPLASGSCDCDRDNVVAVVGPVELGSTPNWAGRSSHKRGLRDDDAAANAVARLTEDEDALLLDLLTAEMVVALLAKSDLLFAVTFKWLRVG